MSKKTTLPEWEQVLSSAAHLQKILPDAVLAGGTAAAIYAGHRLSKDADHVLVDLKKRFDIILAELECVAGWKTARIKRPVQILGSLDGIETGIRQLIRDKPLETMQVEIGGEMITVPTREEMLRIKGVLILGRNATRDYLDFVALADLIGKDGVVRALCRFDEYYPQENGESALQQLQIQLAEPLPYDLDETRLDEYRELVERWRDWGNVRDMARSCAMLIFDRIIGNDCPGDPSPASGPSSDPRP